MPAKIDFKTNTWQMFCYIRFLPEISRGSITFHFDCMYLPYAVENFQPSCSSPLTHLPLAEVFLLLISSCMNI